MKPRLFERVEAWARSRPVTTIAGLLLILSLLFMERGLFPPGGQAVGGLDVRGLFYPWLSIVRDSLGEGRLPVWDIYQYAGYPFLANPQVALFYPPTWLALTLPVNVGISWHIALHLWLAGLGMALFVRRESGADWPVSFLAGLSFAFSGFMAARIYAGHVGLLATFSWLPWILLAAGWSFEQRHVWAGVIAGLPLGLSILAGHTTSMLYVGVVWLAYALFTAMTTRQEVTIVRQTVIVGVAALALSAVSWLPLLEFTSVSSRTSQSTYDWATAFSLPITHLIALLMPAYFGEPVQIGYWSVPNFEELTYYAGVLPALGLILALRKPSARAWFYITLIVVGLLLAFGSYGFLYGLIYDLVPPFRLARAPGRAAALYTFAASALLAEALTRWRRESQSSAEEQSATSLRWLLGAILLVGVTGLAATGAVFVAQHPTDTSGRLWHQLGGWTIFLLVAVIGLVLLERYIRTGKPYLPLVAGLAILVIVDLWLFGFKFVRLNPLDPAPFWSEARQIIDETNERVVPWGLVFFEQNGAEQVGLQSVFGYNALEVAANARFLDVVPDPRSTAYDILGVGYVLSGGSLDDFTGGDRPLELIASSGSVWVYRRSRVMDIVRLVNEVEVIPDEAQAAQRVHDADFRPARTAILAKHPPCSPDPDAARGAARVVESRPGFWRIETQSQTESILALAETAYPGWRVTVDGQPAQSLVAYTVIKAVCVPEGDHVVEWQFVPISLYAGGGVSLAALALIGFAIRRVRQRTQEVTTL